MSGKSTSYVELEQELVAETEKAILIETAFNKKVWIAKSSCTDIDIVEPKKDSQFKMNTVQFRIPYWIAKKEGII